MDPFGTMPNEDPASNWRSWRTKGAWENWKRIPVIFPYLRPYRFLYVFVVVLTILGSVIALAEPWPLAIILDSVLGSKEPRWFLSDLFGAQLDYSEKIGLLVFTVCFGFLITILGHGMEVINNYFAAKLEQNMVLDLRSKLFAHTSRLSLSFHDERYTGQLMSLINMQANSIGEIVMAFPPMFQSFLTLIGMLTIALLIDWQVTLISLVAVPLIYYATALYGTRIVPRIRQTMKLEWGSLSIVFEAMSMLRVIVAFGREKHEHRRFRSQGQTAVDARVKLTVKQTLFTLGVTAATALGTALVLGFGAWHVLRGDITSGEMIVLISYIASVYQPLEQLGTSIGHLHQNLVFLGAAMNLLDKEPEVKEPLDAIDIGRAKGAFTLEKVTFAYDGRPPAVKEVSFDAKAGQRIAVVGPTGAGKTTLVNLILRFYDPKEGAIKIDGVDTRDLKLSCLRENISVVLQEPMLFSGTIAENIRYGRLDATSHEVIEAAKKANAHDFIASLPDGYETELGEGGHQLSGGERQRVCVARAFIRDAPILILDEPTSSIDSKTENVILDGLEELMAGRTSIMIAHRLSTIRDADLILVMNHGELVEKGTHEELRALGGLYSQLFDAQTRIRSRSRTEGGASHQDELIDSISQEVGDRMYQADHPAAPAAPPAPAGTGNGASSEPPPPTPAPSQPPPQPAQPAHEIAAGAGAPPNGAASSPGANGSAPNGSPNGRTPEVVKKIRDGLEAPPGQEIVCGFCERTLLKGERAEPFIAPQGGQKRRTSRWDSMPEASTGDMFAMRRMQGGDLERKLVCELCWALAERAGWSPLQVVEHKK
jgi:ATP-binding cassette, subfamily B, bacterial